MENAVVTFVVFRRTPSFENLPTARRSGSRKMPNPVGRMELFARLGRITVAESMVDNAARYVSDLEWRRKLRSRPATSVYASKFPGGERSCERQIAYSLMNFAHAEPMKPMVGATADVGKAIEEREVRMLEAEGRLLSPGVEAEDQIRIEDNDNWISGKPDIVTLPPFWNRPLLTEKKSKDNDVVEEMRALKRSYDPGHAYQTRVYIAILRELSQTLWPAAVVCKHTWRLALPGNEPVIDAMVCRDHGIHDDSGCLKHIDLQPLQSGVLSYSGRNRPNVMASWYFEHDEAWWQRGLAKLRSAQEYFKADTIPPHPFGGKGWSAQPCQWCDFKKTVCKPDQVDGIRRLSDSNGVAWSQEVYGYFDPFTIREAVLERWREREGFSYTLPPGYEIGRQGVQKERTHA